MTSLRLTPLFYPACLAAFAAEADRPRYLVIGLQVALSDPTRPPEQ